MKVVYKKKELEVKEINLKQRLELTGLSAGIIGSDGGVIQGEGFGKFLVKVFELSGLKDSDFEGLNEGEHIELITKIREAWFPNEKK